MGKVINITIKHRVITFSEKDSETKIVETFDVGNMNPVEMQRGGWQAILDNFKKYTETN